MTRPDLCLDFANTRYWRGQATPTETLNVPADLAIWAKVPKAPSPLAPLPPTADSCVKVSLVKRNGAV